MHTVYYGYAAWCQCSRVGIQNSKLIGSWKFLAHKEIVKLYCKAVFFQNDDKQNINVSLNSNIRSF